MKKLFFMSLFFAHSLFSMGEEKEAELIQASKKGDIVTVKRLVVNEGVKIDASIKGLEPLDAAIFNGHYDIVTFLMSKGARLAEGTLQFAARAGYYNILKFLLGQKDVDINVPGAGGWFLLHEAVDAGNLSLVKLLLEHGAGICINKQTTKLRLTPLHLAACKGYDEIVQYLLKAGASLDITDSDKRTPLGCAQEKHAEADDIKKAKYEETIKVFAEYAHNKQELIEAINYGNIELVTLLLDKIPANACDENGNTLLHLAIKAKRPFIAGKLFAASVKLKKQNSNTQKNL